MDTLKIGKNIAALRKAAGYSQERLAEILCISPQAISKWENGKSLPETAILPKLASLFDCTVDSLLLVENRSTVQIDHRAKQMAKQVLAEISKQISSFDSESLSDDEIAEALYKSEGNIGACIISRQNSFTVDSCTFTEISVKARQIAFELIEKRYGCESPEPKTYQRLSNLLSCIPHAYYINEKRGILLTENPDKKYINGINYDKDCENGQFFRSSLCDIIKELALWHRALWQKADGFYEKNSRFHFEMLLKEYKNYVKSEQNGTVPKVFQGVQNNFSDAEQKVFESALELLSASDKRAVTVIHGNLNPGMINVSKDKKVLFENLSFVRQGAPTDDLAMLLGLHIAPDKADAMPYLESYCKTLAKEDYSFDRLLEDYKVSLAESLLYTLKLINRGIYDFEMKNKAIAAFLEWIDI